ncbi:bifunctional tRNA (5-methylaminomethyl-2-thiouridine)(34)-methyltransferase MnmD/FAD-dependent 5-carboxymethylaminomethyl-2-thiouridine(34) oxidoreductase MnmC [uncultured Campylobacter sp.]|uniref:bifunctional tRNA (5-methylaminomethyl-2-thiouridine)(34)-methyltransferase MnmD/FAD-dependent 5-carboxymethylaminomethyl-2-thiouridine(34) oxidoreductase MnmC n=1 Tax=uncultured Campylobacter sp. TaxID=218934 RepID=UPI0026218911|nr:bifunctional tRNA (5-methylaminomethyl-2-thiouridine)(34)-methyltransferase MnmD/FAD-dependent 5-carboxymethylaminomethyl-2-thiouridine(34) oxidoreductase MnmC [uncultured Campylobacter sp.]
MKKADIEFRQNCIYSKIFDDIYFDSEDGIKESKFVYTRAFEFNDNQDFIIAELGFGIGLNFFLCLERFYEEKIPKRLFYVSLEGFYIEKNELRDIYKKLGFYDRFKEYLEHFLAFYPKAKDGIYRFYFRDCFLDLVFSDATKMIKELDFKADVWFLDGFNPKNNKELFDDFMIKEIARLSKKGASLHTFSASTSLQKSLKKFGFHIEKKKGFKKREMIIAKFDNFDFDDTKAYFTRLYQNKAQKIAIIGSGIAGLSLAYELSLRNFDVEIFDKKDKISDGASGNESGILSSLILKKGVLLGEFSEFSFYEASRFYRQILALKPDGVLEIAHNDLMKDRFFNQKDNILFKINENKAFLEDGLSLKPRQICKALFEKSGAKLHLKHEFIAFSYENTFTLKFKNQSERKGFDILIYALGSDSKDFINYEFMKLSKVRGQLSLAKPFLDNRFALSSKGYVCVKEKDFQVFGASYDRTNSSKEPSMQDDKNNLENIKEFLTDDIVPEIIGSRVSFRSYSSDRFMIAGAFYDENFYKENYKKLFWTKNKAQKKAKNLPNLYLSIAHGSRAFASAIIAARYICALINNEPLGIEKKFVEQIHPARFLIRKLRKGLL